MSFLFSMTHYDQGPPEEKSTSFLSDQQADSLQDYVSRLIWNHSQHTDYTGIS